MSNHDSDAEMRALLGQSQTPPLSDDFYDKLTANLDEEPTVVPGHNPGRNPHRRRLWISGTGATAAAAVAVAIAVSSPFGGSLGQVATPPPVTATTELPLTLASQVIDQARSAYANFQTLSGSFVSTTNTVEESEDAVTQTDFAYKANDYLWTKTASTYRAGQGYEPYRIDTSSRSLRTGEVTTRSEQSASSLDGARVPGGAPYVASYLVQQGVSDDSALFGTYSPQALLDGLSLDGSAKLTSVTVDGVDAWQIDAIGIGLEIADSVYPDRIEAVFEKETLVPLRIQEFRSGEVLTTTEFSNVKVDTELSDSDLQVTVPADADVLREDLGARVTTAAEVPGQVSYTATQPSYVPDGFALVSTTFLDVPINGADAYDSQRQVVTYVYRRGLLSFTYSTGRPLPEPVSSNLSSSEFAITNAKRTPATLDAGAYAGVSATAVTGFAVTPFVETAGGRSQLRVRGDLSVAELLKVANSAAPVAAPTAD